MPFIGRAIENGQTSGGQGDGTGGWLTIPEQTTETEGRENKEGTGMEHLVLHFKNVVL
jgi:hypothetical protein